jgi:hypothetical protein
MRTITIAERRAAAILSAMLLSCSTTQHVLPSGGEALARFVLVVKDQPDGQVSYSWLRAEEFGLPRYEYPPAVNGMDGRVVLATGRPRDCAEENRECIRECMSRPLPRGFGHITWGGRGKGGKEEYCTSRCRQPYLDCEELQQLKPREFLAWDGAVDWLKRNRKALLVGSVITIAGVAFVVVSAGAGVVILAPAVLLTASEVNSESCCVAVSP